MSARRETLVEWVDRIAATHEKFYRAKPMEELCPTIVIETADGETELLTLPWENNFQRSVSLKALRLVLQAGEATRYAIWSEAWMLGADDRDPGQIEALDRVAQDREIHAHPDRKEVITTIAVERAKPSEPVIVTQEIIRGRSGGVRLLRRILDDAEPSLRHCGGALATLFGDPTSH